MRNPQRIFVLALLLMATGCVKHIDTLRDAQAIFNRAAEADNRQNLSGAAIPVDEASSGYAVAEKMLDDLISKNKSDLDHDRLLCTALAMRAMSLWRLGRLDTARSLSTGTEAQACAAKTDEAPRDVSLLLAVPALIRIDEANRVYVEDRQRAQLGGPVLPAHRARFDDIREKILGTNNSAFGNRGALCALQTAAKEVPENPVQTYFAMSMLAGLRIVHAATEVDLIPGSDDQTKANDDASSKAMQVILSLRRVLGLEGTGTKTAAAPAVAQSLEGWLLLFGRTDGELEQARKAPVINFCM